jgi:hypothetical protein
MAWRNGEIILENRNLQQFTTRNLDFHLSFKAQSSCLMLLLTRFVGIDVAWWENLKTFTIILQCLHLWGKVHSPCTTKKQANDEISILPIIRLLRFYNSKFCCCKLRWNCKKESWQSLYNHFPNPDRVVLCQLGHEQLQRTFIAHAYSFKYSKTTTSSTCHRFFALARTQHDDDEQ